MYVRACVCVDRDRCGSVTLSCVTGARPLSGMTRCSSTGRRWGPAPCSRHSPTRTLTSTTLSKAATPPHPTPPPLCSCLHCLSGHTFSYSIQYLYIVVGVTILPFAKRFEVDTNEPERLYVYVPLIMMLEMLLLFLSLACGLLCIADETYITVM